jgi:hypothetical protein
VPNTSENRRRVPGSAVSEGLSLDRCEIEDDRLAMRSQRTPCFLKTTSEVERMPCSAQGDGSTKIASLPKFPLITGSRW